MEYINRYKNKIHKFLHPSFSKRATVGPPELWKMKQKFQFNFLINAGLEQHHYLLDIGCGTLRGGIAFIKYLDKGHYYGFDVRKKVIEEGEKILLKKRLSNKCPVLTYENSIMDYNIKKKFDFIWAFSVILHMSDAILEDTLKFVKESLGPTGSLYANINIGNHTLERSWNGYPVIFRSLGFYKDLFLKYNFECNDIGSLIELGHKSNNKEQDSQRMLKIRHLNV